MSESDRSDSVFWGKKHELQVIGIDFARWWWWCAYKKVSVAFKFTFFSVIGSGIEYRGVVIRVK